MQKSPAAPYVGLAELSRHEPRDRSTDFPCFFGGFGLGEDTDDGFGARGADEDTAAIAEHGSQALGLVEDRLRYLPPGDSDVLLRLRIAAHDCNRLAQRPTRE